MSTKQSVNVYNLPSSTTGLGVLAQVFVVALGGALGAAARFLVQLGFGSGSAPLAVLMVNVLGSMLAGMGLQWFTASALSSGWSTSLSLLFVTGFCGAFTTMSAMTVQARELALNESFLVAGGYSLLSVALSIGALLLGAWMIR
ncbi:MAG: CrcB family protein [Pseudomonadota bacterium]